RAPEPRRLTPSPDQRAQLTLLLVPIYVGVAEPEEPEEFIRNPASAPSDPSAWPAWIMAMYNAQRARWKRGPLLTDARLTALAEHRAKTVAGILTESVLEHDLRKTLEGAGIAVREHQWSTDHFDTVADFAYMQL